MSIIPKYVVQYPELWDINLEPTATNTTKHTLTDLGLHLGGDELLDLVAGQNLREDLRTHLRKLGLALTCYSDQRSNEMSRKPFLNGTVFVC